MKALLAWLLPRLSQPSTWVGIGTFVATTIGVAIKPEWWEAISTAGVTIASAALVAVNEGKASGPSPTPSSSPSPDGRGPG